MESVNDSFTVRFLLRLLFFLIALFWSAGIASPCLDFNMFHLAYPYLKLGYSTVCHQNVNKSFVCGNSTFLVCARCSGIYFSVLLTSFVILFIKAKIRIKIGYLILFSIPMLADVIFYSLGFYNYSKIGASLTGLLFGSVVFLYILSAIENSFTQTKSNK